MSKAGFTRGQADSKTLYDLVESWLEAEQSADAASAEAARARAELIRGLAVTLPTLKNLRAEATLPPRQSEVLQLIALGNGRRQTGDALGITVNAVKSHLSAARRRLDVTTTAAAVAEAKTSVRSLNPARTRMAVG